MDKPSPGLRPPVERTAVQPARRTFISSALLVMAATLASRVLGITRDIILANQFGTDENFAAYKTAFRIPDMLYLLIIGGALGSSLIPLFSRYLGQQEPQKAWKLANTVVNYALVALAFFSALTWVLAPSIVAYLLAPGFDPALQELTTDLSRMLLIQPFFIGLGGIALALLNGNEKFFWPALAPLLYNLSIIAGALWLVEPLGIYGVVWGVIAGAILYLLVQLPALLGLGFYWRPSLEIAEGGMPVLAALGPRLLGQAAFQANFFIATNLASGMTSGPQRVSAFEYAYQLFMLPHGIFALSLATVCFPAMARLLGMQDLPGMKQTLSGTLRQVVFLTLPASVGLGLLAQPIITAVFEAGKFQATSTLLVTQALICFSFGLVSYGVVEILTRAFYALQDTATPVIVALVTVGLNVILSLLFTRPLQHAGLALALAVSTTLEMVLLGWCLRRKIGPLNSGSRRALFVPLLKIGAAAAAMGLALLVTLQLVRVPLQTGGKLIVIVITLLVVAEGAAVYGLTAYLLRLEELRSVLKRFLKR